MPSRYGFAVALAVLLPASVVIGADDPVMQRRQIMSKVERAEGAANNLILGKFFPAKAVAAMKALEDNLTLFPNLFPDGSDQGETKASPAIWKNMDDFKSLATKLVTDAKAAEAAVPDGQDAFAKAFSVVEKDCAACHAKYHVGR